MWTFFLQFTLGLMVLRCVSAAVVASENTKETTEENTEQETTQGTTEQREETTGENTLETTKQTVPKVKTPPLSRLPLFHLCVHLSHQTLGPSVSDLQVCWSKCSCPSRTPPTFSDAAAAAQPTTTPRTKVQTDDCSACHTRYQQEKACLDVPVMPQPGVAQLLFIYATNWNETKTVYPWWLRLLNLENSSDQLQRTRPAHQSTEGALAHIPGIIMSHHGTF